MVHKNHSRAKSPPEMQSIFASVGRTWVIRIVWACLGLILLGVSVAILVFGDVPHPEPLSRPHFEAWEVILMFLSWFAISSFVYVAWQLAMHEVRAFGRKPTRILWNAGLVLVNALVILLVVEVFALHVTGMNWSDLGFKRLGWGWFLASLGLGLLSMVLSGGVAALVMRAVDPDWVNKQETFILPEEQSTIALEEPGDGEGKKRLSWVGGIAMVLLVGVAVPIVEEILFRGVLYAWLTELMPWAVAAVLSSVVFGLAHFEAGRPVVVACAVAGLFMALAFHYSHSLFAPIIIHAVNNITKVVLTYLLRK